MKIKYLIKDDFDKACTSLAAIVAEKSKPDIVIGVRSGGGFVGRKMLENWPSSPPDYKEIEIKRELTKKKEKFKVSSILKKLPRFLTEILIKAEVHYLEVRNTKNTKRIIPDHFIGEFEDYFSGNSEIKALIVDDCIDTGNTLSVLKNFLIKLNPNVKVEIATITITHKNPIINADYTLYNRTICRFPWSMEIEQE
ncbi:MAG: phosphoribosyltransferase family protein [Reichenbachiella sp.]|uniref:phosphoribosyltransferase family protein n=1 Tax=Reichenbachiella sp. TaxID=2184521 RepID=UPI00329A588A